MPFPATAVGEPRAPDTHRIDHGASCECAVLAQALGLSPRAVTYAFCAQVLQRRWRMTCRHGSAEPAIPPRDSTGRWKDLGEIDEVTAILVHDGTSPD